MSSSLAVHSQAFNFRSYVESGVDPRTGQYTLSLSLPEVKSHALAGPALPLQLAFNPMNTRDGGFGLGWSLNLTEYAPQTRFLSLGTGESFMVSGTSDPLTIEEQKLESFHFHALGPDQYRVVHRTGGVEILRADSIDGKVLALPEQVVGADGRTLELEYVVFRGVRRLESVSDPTGVLLKINRDETADEVEILFYPGRGADGGALARFVLELDSDDRVTRVVLPTDEPASWRLAYEPIRGIHCLSEVWTPTGGHEIITYGDRNDPGHAFPGGALPALPRVTTHVVEPGFGQPPMEVRYTYSNENFLGHGALDSWNDDGLDNLYQVTSITFKYTSTQQLWSDGVMQREVKRTYNRFHLMTEEATTQGNNRKRVFTEYHADHEDNLYLQFKDQPPYCQLPMRITTYWEKANDGTQQRTEVAETWFDDDGNLTEQINPDGTREVLTYYEKEGEPGLCPQDPEGFKRSVRSRTAHPAASTYGSAPTLRTDYQYISLAPLPGPHNRSFLMESLQILSEEGGAELQRVETTYYNAPTDTLQHGRPKVVTETMNNLPTVTDHRYATLDSTRAGARVLQVIETVTGFDGTHRAITQEHSLLNGEPLLVQDDNGVEIRYRYDALGRVTDETVAPDTEYVATRTYAYHLVDGTDEDQPWQLLSDVKRVQTRSWFDGAARTVKEERQDVDAAVANGQNPKNAAFRSTYLAKYNGLGELIEETDIDWLETVDRPLVSAYGYDDWGERVSTKRPDSVVEWDVLDPISTPADPGPTRRSWLVDTAGTAGGVVQTWLDAFDEPVRIERFDAKGASISEETQHRDGLGRLVEHIDARDQPTKYRYDAFDRTIQTDLPPSNAVVTRSYAPHSAEDLPITIAVNNVELGTQAFDGLDRRVEATTGGRLRAFEYEGSKARPSKVITPARKTIGYTYVEPLGEEVVARQLDSGAASYTYDPENSRLTGCDEQGIGLQREYFSTGEVKRETRQYADGGADQVADYRYSLRGRLLGTTMLDSTQVNTYDGAGRIALARLDTTETTFSYDRFGRLEKTVSNDREGSSTLTITIEYDDLGREILRTFDANGEVRKLEQTYHPDDALATRVLTEGGVVLRNEGFHYDPRGRLLRHTCAGTELPQDAYGKTFTQQVFTSDAMDNITRVVTTWNESGSNVNDTATFHYEGDDPVQLTRITHSHSDYPAEIVLDYDPDGNLIVDEQGRSLTYDALGRLIDVGALGHLAAATYRFDALDVLAERSEGGRNERRYYVDGTLTARVEDGQRSHYLRAEGHILAEHITGTDAGTVLLATDRSNTVLGEVRPGAEQHVAYTAYGFPGRGPLWTDVAYNGELHETGTGWQLLGNGYRAYNPVLQRFHSADDLSPFARGGINAYAYCGNNPVNLIDPSGHWWQFGLAVAGFGAAAFAGSFLVKDDPTLQRAMQIAGGALVLAGLGVVAKYKLAPHKKTSAPTKKGDPNWIKQGRADEAAKSSPSVAQTPKENIYETVGPPSSPVYETLGPPPPPPPRTPPLVRWVEESDLGLMSRLHEKTWNRDTSLLDMQLRWPDRSNPYRGNYPSDPALANVKARNSGDVAKQRTRKRNNIRK
jgi:RHS repeat-associated protein